MFKLSPPLPFHVESVSTSNIPSPPLGLRLSHFTLILCPPIPLFCLLQYRSELIPSLPIHSLLILSLPILLRVDSVSAYPIHVDSVSAYPVHVDSVFAYPVTC